MLKRRLIVCAAIVALVACGGGSEDASSASSGLVSALKGTPSSMMIFYAEKDFFGTLKELSKSPKDPMAEMTKYGIQPEDLESILFTFDLAKMFSGKGGFFVSVHGTLPKAKLTAAVEGDGYAKKEDKGGFAVFTRKTEGQPAEEYVAVGENVFLTGMKQDLEAGLELAAGKGSSAYDAKGVKGALDRAGSAGMAVVMIVPPDAKAGEDKDHKIDAMVMAVNSVSADKTARVTMVFACPDEENAKKALADMKRQYEEKKDTTEGKLLSSKLDGTFLVVKVEGPLDELSPMKSGR